MEPAAILEQLIASEELPKAALRAASDQRADMAPLFVERLENYLAGDSAELERRALLLIFHLLGEWRETSAYRTLARLLRCPREQIEKALGDSITETSYRVMAAVCDGNPYPIYDIILDANADEYVRASMCDALAVLVLQGKLDRAEVASFLRDCWINLQPRETCYVWCGWQGAIAILGLTQLKSVVKEAFDSGLIDSGWISYRHFERDLERAVQNPTEPGHEWDDFTLFGDTIEELSTWYCFSEEYNEERERLRNAPPAPLFPLFASEPIRNPMRGVGRNDPCPCGSGKKYKKCCLH
jgi:Protein of unknown function (DUF1186)/SEC-C motif